MVRLEKRVLGSFLMQEQDRDVKLMTDFWRGIGFKAPQFIFTNDQDLTNTTVVVD
jgi:hypothetical protein